MKRKVISLLCITALLFTLALPASAARPTHGTAANWITEDMLTTQIHSSYRIDPSTQGKAMDGAYNAYFLKDRLQTVSIVIDENNLNYLLQNAKDEPYVMTSSVTIGDKTLGYCGLRTKGNFTLAHAYTDNPGSDRFSFTVNFGEYVDKARFGEKQTFFGCDRISFNNFFFDKSMLKEFFALMLMEEMGLPTPQFGLAKLYINGQYYGVYAMVEALDESILEQHYQVDDRELSSYLCKPTGTRFRYEDLKKDPSPLYEGSDEKHAEVGDMLPTALEWARKLNCLAAGTDFEGNPIDVQSENYLKLLSQVMDVEETVTYFAVHSWLCQLDNMFVGLQNFGLYLSPQGVSTLLPWDYDLAFGCYFPSTAENTANYPIDVMYKLNDQMWDKEQTHSESIYKAFPLFYVIYQNDALMEKYHQAMLDCSRIAALGGTTAAGKTYETAYFNSFIDTLEKPLLEAAGEKLASNVYYMNFIQQPRDVRAALPHLTRVIAMRAVGVYNQVTGSDAWVTSSGANLETLGNGIRGENTNAGYLTVIDPATGIFVNAEFAGGRRTQTPVLAAKVLGEKDKAYQTAWESLQCDEKDKILVYELKTTVKPTGGYRLTLPLDGAYAKEEAKHSFYLLSGSTLSPIDMQRDGNLYSCDLNSLGTIVVLLDRSVLPSPVGGSAVIGIVAGSAFAAILAGIAIVTLAKKKKKQ